MKVKITSDSTCDLSPALINQYDIGILPLLITFGEEAFRDGVDASPEDIYRFVEETKTLPKTCALNTTEYEEFAAGQTKDMIWSIFASAASFHPPVRMRR